MRAFLQRVKVLEGAVRIAPLCVVLIIWEAICRVGLFSRQLFPPPTTVWLAFVEMVGRGEMADDVTSSVVRAGVGYLLGCIVGVSVGTVTGRFPMAERLLGQVIHVLRSFPPVAIVPFAILWFGIAEASKFFLVFWGVFFPVWVNTHAGMRQVEQTHTWAARSLGAGSYRLLTETLLPGALPHILVGMRVAIGIAFICVFVAEMSGAYEGVGFRISTSYLIFRVDRMVAALLVLGGMGAGADFVFRTVTGRLFPWVRLGSHG